MAIASLAGMKDIQPVIDALLATRRAGFRNKHLAEALGVSRARASQLLATRVLSGELKRVGEGPRKYIRGPDCGDRPGGVARAASLSGFWRALVEDCPNLAYVSVGGLALTDLRTQQQVRTLLRGLVSHRLFLVVDFAGVRSISEAASRELFLNVPRRDTIWVEPINLEPAVGRTIVRVVRLDDEAVKSGASGPGR